MNPSRGEGAVQEVSVDYIDALLPQTQCIRCGYPSCREYAEALVTGLTDLNRCPPGGAVTIAALAKALDRAPKTLDPACGGQRPWVVARVDEAACIGCTLCIQACPVDAILGAARRMHTVIESECTGCELCLDPCPTDCIDLSPVAAPLTNMDPQARRDTKAADAFLERWMRERAPRARRRFHARQQRLVRLRRPRTERRRLQRAAIAHGSAGAAKHRECARAAMPGRDADRATKQAIIRGAVNRVRHRRRAHDK